MATVPIHINGVLRTKNVEPLSNFVLYVCEQNENIDTHAGNNVTTAPGLAAFKALLEGYITDANAGHPAGTITSSSVTVNTNNGHITVNIYGTGNNAATKFPGSFFTAETWSLKDQHSVSFQFLANGSEGITICDDCQDITLPNCEDPTVEIDIANGEYTATLEDETTGVAYTQTVTATDGSFTWDASLPEGLLTPFSVYTLSLVDSDGNHVSWITGEVEYNCVRLTFQSFVDTNPPT